METKWIYCPVCASRTRTKIRPDTQAKNLIVFCPKCKAESLMNVDNFFASPVKNN